MPRFRLNKLRGMNSDAKKKARRLKKRAKRLAKGKAAAEAKAKAEKELSKMKAGQTVDAKNMLDMGSNLAADLAKGLQQEVGDGAAEDASELLDGLKTQFGDDFAARRAALSAKMGGAGDGAHAETAAKIEKRALALKDEGFAIFKDVRTPDDALKAMRENPKVRSPHLHC